MKSLRKIAMPVTLQSMLQESFSINDQIMIRMCVKATVFIVMITFIINNCADAKFIRTEILFLYKYKLKCLFCPLRICVVYIGNSIMH